MKSSKNLLSITQLVLFVVSALLLAGCTTQLPSRIPVREIPPSEGSITGLFHDRLNRTTVSVGSFVDSRPRAVTADVAGREMVTEANLGHLLREAVEKGLNGHGARTTHFGRLTLQGEITELWADVAATAPISEIRAVASIRVMIVDGREKVIHRAVYSAQAATRQLFLNEFKIGKTLALTLGEAVNQALSDETVIKILNG